MFTVDAVIAHFVGDYFLQSNKMSVEKTKKWRVAAWHGLTYSLPFILLDPSLIAFLIILGTHIIIDRLRLTTYISWFRNGANYDRTANFGYPPSVPAFLSIWLMILVDNLTHILINGLALYYF